MSMIRKYKGSIAIGTALFLCVFVALLVQGISVLKKESGKVQAASGMEAGMYSLFAQYDRDLLEEYDLFFIDGGYGSEKLQPAVCLSVIEEYAAQIWESGVTKCQKEQSALEGYVLATDDGGSAFQRQAVEYMKKHMTAAAVTDLWNKTTNAEQIVSKQEQDKTAPLPEMEGLPAFEEKTEEKQESKPGEEKPKENLIEVIRKIRAQGILSLTVPGEVEISASGRAHEKQLESRTVQSGFGAVTGYEKYTANGLDTCFLREYMIEKCPDFLDKKEGNGANYQLEYILMGQDSDTDNLKKVVNRLLMIREAANAAFLYNDYEKRAEARVMAAGLTTAFLLPEAAPVIEGILILGWAYVESLYDVRCLLEGKKTPIVKDSASWRVGLKEIPQIFQILEEEKKDAVHGISYQEYLRILLYLGKKEIQVKRCMDMIEQSIQEKEGRGNFHIDSCMDAISVRMKIKGAGKEVWEAQRDYGYGM